MWRGGLEEMPIKPTFQAVMPLFFMVGRQCLLDGQRSQQILKVADKDEGK
jgi:hypothetical protein